MQGLAFGYLISILMVVFKLLGKAIPNIQYMNIICNSLINQHYLMQN